MECRRRYAESRIALMAENEQPEGSHVHWPSGLGFPTAPGDDGVDAEIFAALHRISDVRFPNDDYVGSYGVTLEEMRNDGAV